MKVLIQSFSFKRTGYPVDKTGNGGGFVFDCRAIDAYDYTFKENPNAPFLHMHLTGLDPEVVSILDQDSDTQEFFEAVWIMVRLDAEKCLRRGFDVMTVNFGCTAGQHRSVYMAERLAARLRLSLIDTELVHLERLYWPIKS